MAKKKKAKVLLAQSVTDYMTTVHVAIPSDLTGKQIIEKTAGRSHSRATCCRCDVAYAYTGKNPGYCPECYKIKMRRG